MKQKLILLMTVLLCSVAVSKSYADEEVLLDRVREVLNEDDYDDFRKEFDARNLGETVDNYRVGLKESQLVEVDYPKMNPRFHATQNREIFPERDFEGNCPPGFRTDKIGNCREIW